MFKRPALVLALLLAAAGCARQGGQTADTQQAAGTDGFKIGLMTGTVSQNEEEYRAGQQVAAKYGDRVVHVTYPDNFMNEQETTISQLVGLASDPDVKVIVASQAVPGSIAPSTSNRFPNPSRLLGFSLYLLS